MKIVTTLFALSGVILAAVYGRNCGSGPDAQGFRISIRSPQLRFHIAEAGAEHGLHGCRPARHAKRPDRCALHGKNFCSATWGKTIHALSAAGYRVIAPDQIGFCKSSKPEHYQYSFQQLAANTHALLAGLGVKDPVIMGHSTGGMLAFRYALMYPQETAGLVAVNPIGLEDWKAKGVPLVTIDELYQGELKTTAEGIRAYERKTYYAGEWKPDYDKWVDMLAGMYAGKEGELFAWSQALTSDMIFCQPVVYEFGNIRVPTLLMIGEKDNTAIGKNRAPAEVSSALAITRSLARRPRRQSRLHTRDFPGLWTCAANPGSGGIQRIAAEQSGEALPGENSQIVRMPIRWAGSFTYGNIAPRFREKLLYLQQEIAIHNC